MGIDKGRGQGCRRRWTGQWTAVCMCVCVGVPVGGTAGPEQTSYLSLCLLLFRPATVSFPI